MDYHDATSVLQVNYFLRHKSVLIKIASGRSRKMEHETDFISLQHSVNSEMSLSALCGRSSRTWR